MNIQTLILIFMNIVKSSALFLGTSSLLLLSGCFSENTENNYALTEKNTPYTLEQAKNSEKVLIEEFSDIECPACKGFAPIFEKLEKDFSSNANVEFRYYHYPLEQIHDFAFPAALASECVSEIAGTEARKKYINAAFVEKRLSIDFFRSLAKEQEIDEEKFSSCFDEQKTKSIIKAHEKEGNDRKLRGTPTLYINGEEYKKSRDYDTLYSEIQKRLNEKK